MEREVFMERKYRGYPQPYMIYDREQQVQQSPQAAYSEDRRRMRAEHEYFKGIYPMTARRPQRFVEAEVDRMDAPGSAMYDEYPDREQLYRMRDRILDDTESDGFREDRDLVLVLLLNEMVRRRAERM